MTYQKKSTDDQPQTIGEVSAKLGDIMNQVKSFGEDVAKKMQAGETVTEELKQRTDESLTQMAELKERLTELEQKSARSQEEPPRVVKTLGQMVIESEAFENMSSSDRKGIRVQMSRKDLMNVTATTGTGASPTNSLTVADRVPGIIAPPERAMTIRDLLIPGETDAANMEFIQETGFTNNAAPVAEGDKKPQSEITFDLKAAPVRTIAHLFKASRQILDDAKGLASYIDGRARYGLRLAEEKQLLSGDGTGMNILGIIPQASAFSPKVTLSSATAIDRMRLAILQAVLAEYPASGIVLNPIDWASIELTKDGEGRYIIAQPVNGSVARLWGLPVVETQAMAQNNFLTGAFGMAAQIFDRMEIEVLLSTENEDDFARNMVTIRAEERLAMAVYRPEAFVTGQVTASSAG
ncbi:phage major capsid protein [Salmonella enterica subsp. enterica]